MGLDQRVFLIGQRAALLDQALVDKDLSDVVQQRAAAQRDQVADGKVEGEAHHDGQHRHVHGVAVGIVVEAGQVQHIDQHIPVAGQLPHDVLHLRGDVGPAGRLPALLRGGDDPVQAPHRFPPQLLVDEVGHLDVPGEVVVDVDAGVAAAADGFDIAFVQRDASGQHGVDAAVQRLCQPHPVTQTVCRYESHGVSLSADAHGSRVQTFPARRHAPCRNVLIIGESPENVNHRVLPAQRAGMAVRTRGGETPYHNNSGRPGRGSAARSRDQGPPPFQAAGAALELPEPAAFPTSDCPLLSAAPPSAGAETAACRPVWSMV